MFSGLTSDALATHINVQCDGCRKKPIVGVRFKCNICYDYDLCEPCVARGTHSQHSFMKILDSKYSYADGKKSKIQFRVSVCL